ncbi:MAG: 2-phospho-L-lactate transferase [Ilumatobacteraceae bacterium]
MRASPDVVVLAGGVGAARFLRALHLARPDAEVLAIVNTGDDTVANGLHVSPDIDTVIYTLATAIDPERGWGLRDETWTAMQSLARYAAVRPSTSLAPNDWFNLGDRDLATHLYRTARLREGATLEEVTTEIARAWNVPYRVIPMSNHSVETRVTLAEASTASDGHHYPQGQTVSFQEYFVRLKHGVPVSNVAFVGADTATPLGMHELSSATCVVIAPSNPVVSIGPLRALSGVDSTLRERRESVVAISPIIGGAALKGPADRMLRELGHESSALGVARMYAPICGTLVIDTVDAALRPSIEALGMRCIVTDTIMKLPDVARALAETAVAAAATPNMMAPR